MKLNAQQYYGNMYLTSLNYEYTIYIYIIRIIYELNKYITTLYWDHKS